MISVGSHLLTKFVSPLKPFNKEGQKKKNQLLLHIKATDFRRTEKGAGQISIKTFNSSPDRHPDPTTMQPGLCCLGRSQINQYIIEITINYNHINP
jgi:hypothetical protein